MNGHHGAELAKKEIVAIINLSNLIRRCRFNWNDNPSDTM
jgi:hypothetical protein